MYNTYDVHFYAAFALAQLWPDIEACIQYEFRDSVHVEDQQLARRGLYDGNKMHRKVKGSVPHDIGDPGSFYHYSSTSRSVLTWPTCTYIFLPAGEEPFEIINSYPIHDVSQWRDLNPKFILSCYRIYYFRKNLDQLRDFWPTVKDVSEL